MKFKLVESLLIEDIASFKKKYPDIEDDIFYKLLNADPTYKGGDNRGTYAQWIMDLYGRTKKQGKEPLRRLVDEDLYKVTEYLTDFEQNKKYFSNKDINQFKTLPDLVKALDSIQPTEMSDRQKVRQNQKARKYADLGREADLVYEDSDWEVWIPHTYAASCKLGEGSHWCTASTESDSYYNNYKDEYGGEYYININKNNPKEKYQFHFESNQFMDINDNPIDLQDFLDKNSKLKSYYTPIGTKILFKKLNIDTSAEEIPVVIDKKTFAKRLYEEIRSRDSVSEDFIYDCLMGDLFDYFAESGDYIDRSSIKYALDDISEDNRKKLSALGCNDLKDIYAIENDFPSIYDALFRATSDAVSIGAEGECISDFENAIENAKPTIVKQFDINYGDEDVMITVDGKALKDNIFYVLADGFNDEDTEDLDEVICDLYAGDFKFYEPRYGWNGFDKGTFNEVLDDRLSEITTDNDSEE